MTSKLEEAADRWTCGKWNWSNEPMIKREAFRAAARRIYEEASRFEEQRAEKYIRRNAPYIKMKDLAEICEVGE